MWAIGSRLSSVAQLSWFAVAAGNLAGMALWPSWETSPLHACCAGFAIAYALRFRGLRPTSLILALLTITTAVLAFHDAIAGSDFWEVLEGPLVAGMFVVIVWYAQRRQKAVEEMEHLGRQRAQLLEHQERLLHDVSHELRTPVTIARGHLETIGRENGGRAPEIGVAIDELDRIARIVDRLLLLAKAEQPEFLEPTDIELEPFLEEIFLRWSQVAPRAWRLGEVPAGTLRADPHRLRTAIDALLENALHHTTSSDRIELGARELDGVIAIDIGDTGPGISTEQLDRVFARFARADTSRNRRSGGVGLGLAIVDAIVRAHGGECTVDTSGAGSTFSLLLPSADRGRGVPSPSRVITDANAALPS
jgi:signal transduction histidine kinase